MGAIDGYISGWAKFIKVAKHARVSTLLKSMKSPLVRNLILAVTKGITFAINSFIKSLSRKSGESWDKAVRRWLGV